MEKVIEFAKNNNIEYFEDEYGIYYFKANDVGEVLEYKNIREAIKSFISKENIKKSSDFAERKKKKNDQPHTTYINYFGVKELISKSKKLKIKEIAEELGMNINDFVTVRKETSTIKFIMRAFKGEQMITQAKMDNYWIDLYFPKYNICVECDEEAHFTEKHQREDKIRQKYLEDKYGCIFVRYQPEKNDKSVAKCINKIFKLILKSK